MKTAVISDIHANLEALSAVLDHADAGGCDAIVCLGDIVGYNADPVACIETMRDHPRTRCILGNHDAMAVGRGPLRGIHPLAREAMAWTRLQLDENHRAWLAGLPLTIADADATYIHASLDDPTAWKYVHLAGAAALHMARQTTRVSFVGHSHKIFAWSSDGSTPVLHETDDLDLSSAPAWLISVGSVGQPRDGDSRAGYAVYDAGADRVRHHRVDYDVETAKRKILDAGLPPQLADRL